MPPPEQKKSKKADNWFEEEDSEDDGTPAATELVQDSRVIQSQKKMEEATRHGEEFWEEAESEGKEKLKEKMKQELVERERKKKEQRELLENISLDDKDVFNKFKQASSAFSMRRTNKALKSKEEDFMTLEEASELPKGGSKKRGDERDGDKQERGGEGDMKKETKSYSNKFR